MQKIEVGTLIKTYTNDSDAVKRVERVFNEDDGDVYRVHFLKRQTLSDTDLVNESDIRQIMVNGEWIDFE